MKNEKLKYSMKKKSAVICLICVICVPWLLASCVKDELHNTPHPDQGVVSISVDYPQGTGEEDYTVEVDGQPLDEGDNASNPLTPGEHTVLVYNTPEGFTVTDGIAYVERVDDTRALTDLIDPLPETLYSGTKTVTVVADDTLHLDLSVAQRTRDLRLQLTVTEGDPERIAAITGTLSGVAGAYDLRSETLHGEAVSTRPAFTRSGDKGRPALARHDGRGANADACPHFHRRADTDHRERPDGNPCRIWQRHDRTVHADCRAAHPDGGRLLRQHYRLGSGGRRTRGYTLR